MRVYGPSVRSGLVGRRGQVMNDPSEVSGSPLSVGVHAMVVCCFEPRLDVIDGKRLRSLGSLNAERHVSGGIHLAVA